MVKQYIIANWKMNGSAALARELALAADRTASALPGEVQLVLCPPAVYLQELAGALKDGRVAVGGQDCHAQVNGAFTGEISANMLADAGAKYVIVGHSERRKQHGETDAEVRAKAEAALKSSLIPVICVGESLAERESGKAIDVVVAQAKASLPTNYQLPTTHHFLLAYEPIWAIGSGQIPSVADIEAMHQALAGSLPASVPVIYGGSVTPENAKSILQASCVSGVLVGGASLKAESFSAIASAAV